ncbi:MAG: triose-phosphate isomerase [Candidatus Cloacimonadota bacterium]|nr:triose-phosphate isomerase [Candidatus Cloacimonadota bacterium]
MRKTIISGNWKMNKTVEEANDFFQGISDWEKNFKHNNQILIFPPNLYIQNALKILSKNSIDIGVQNIYYKDFGAYTGEISPKMILSIGCKYSLVGHSERRKIFHETDEDINRKVTSLISNGLNVVMCIGETEEQRLAEKTEKVLEKQLSLGLKDISDKDMENIVIAYEPVWAIGTGKTATPEIAEQAHKFIRDWLSQKFGKKIADETSILYGGSIKVSNIGELIAQEDIDGGLIGGASLNLNDFKKIIEISEDGHNASLS